MAIVSSNALSASASFDQLQNRKYSIVYRVITDDPLDGPTTAANGTGLTSASTYSFGNESDSGATFDGISSAREHGEDKGRKLWLVTAEFKTNFDGDREHCSSTQIINPLQMPPVISGSFAQFEKALRKDAAGQDITNSAGSPITDLVRDDSRPTLVIEINLASVNLAQLLDFRDTRNSTTFFGLPARFWKLQRSDWARAYYGTCSVYYPHRFEFHADENKWMESVPNVGFYEIDGAGDLQAIMEGTPPLPVVEQVPLNAAGGKLAAGSPLQYVDVDKYSVRNFGALGIPTTL